MPHEVVASIQLTLPEPPGEMAGRLGEVADAWAGMLAALDPFEGCATFSVNEVRKRSDAGTKRPRKPRLAAVEPPEAA